MPDGVAAKSAAKTKAEKTKNDKSKAEKGKLEKKSDNIFVRISRFVRESYIEVVKKAAWPTWPELKKFTTVVIIAVVIIGIWIGGLDYILSKLTHPLISRR
ncbi:MAG: preprotein translocase subunit SecE [Armatimonadetes bacterium]|nr:preprotein translocase subunit SecE [Armatimonadota bacterium]